MSLPLSLGIVATGISPDDNEGAIQVSGVVGGKTKNASCSELGDERVVVSLEVSNSQESDGYMRWSYGPRDSGRVLPDLPFPTTPNQDSARFAQLAIGCSNPTSIES